MIHAERTLEDAILAFTLGETNEALKILSQLSENQPGSIDVWRIG